MLISISSSDLDSGRRPIAISDEFSEISILVSEIRRCENKAFPKKRPTYWDFESEPIKLSRTTSGEKDSPSISANQAGDLPDLISNAPSLKLCS